jgi:hypothetical protein
MRVRKHSKWWENERAKLESTIEMRTQTRRMNLQRSFYRDVLSPGSTSLAGPELGEGLGAPLKLGAPLTLGPLVGPDEGALLKVGCELGPEEGSEIADAEGATFAAAALLPWLHDCDSVDADIIFDIMRAVDNRTKNRGASGWASTSWRNSCKKRSF